MNYKNKLMGLSLIIVAMFSACSDEVENAGRDSGTGDHRDLHGSEHSFPTRRSSDLEEYL